MNLLNWLAPRPTLSDDEVNHGLRMMTLEGIASLAMFSVTSSGILAAFALALGANNFQIGVLAALPFITQPVQIPAILLVERFRWRKAIALLSWVPAQSMWFLIALIPVFVGAPSRVGVLMLLGLLALRGLLAGVTGCAWNSWIRDLVPQQILGSYFARRLALATVASMIFGLAGAFFVDFWGSRASTEDVVFGYTFVILAGAVFLGMGTPLFMSQMPEPLMPPRIGPQPSLLSSLSVPFKDRNFRQLVNFLLFWSFASNLAIPFITIYMLQRLGFPLTAVIALNTLAQLTNVLFMRVWGPFADKFGSKVVLSTCASLYLLVIFGWIFTTQPDPHAFTVPTVIVLQIFAGIALAGVTLTVGTIGLKLAPQGEATSYMATASLATNLGAGLGPLAGGLFADFFSVRKFTVSFEWVDPVRTYQFPAFDLVGFDFLFGIACVIGIITLNTLTTIREEGEVDREVVIEELLAPTRGMTRAMGSIPGLRVLGEYPYAYMRKVPGLDVALGVTAYQLASTVRTAVTAANRSTDRANQVADHVRSALSRTLAQGGDLGESGIDLALYAAKGTMNAVGEITTDAGVLARGAVLGALRALGGSPSRPRAKVRAAAQGTVLGASESGADVAQAAVQAVAGARDAAAGLGISPQEAASQAARGALQAAASLGAETAAQVQAAFRREGIPADFPDVELPDQ